MKRLVIVCAMVLPLVALTAGPAQAEVKTREKSLIKFEGMLGRMVGMFGGKAAKDGLESTTAVKGNRKSTISDVTGHIVDLSEEKIYDLDTKKKTYEVTTFEEMRRRMREAREKAGKDAQKEQGKEEKPSEPQKEYEVDFDVKETGQKKQLAGYDTREVVMTITVREKGKTLEDGGGVVMTADSWMAPTIAAMKELTDFEVRYWKQLQPDAPGLSAEQMAAVVAMYPMVKSAMERLQKESGKLSGTPLATTTTFESVKSKAQLSTQSENSGGGGGGMSGMLARKMMKKDAGDAKARSTIFTMNHEVLEVSTSVAASDLAIPPDYKEKK
jgi:hypothetical protein